MLEPPIVAESGPKWTVLMGQNGWSYKWTVQRKWTVSIAKVDGPGPKKWTVQKSNFSYLYRR